MLHEALLVPVVLYGSETMMGREKERSRIRTEQMDIIKGLLGIGKMDRLLHVQIREM